ncbi:ankyrin-1-like [Lineus longissimus]|uniref:ankyrin-1-like n=1 Tax=Lineus longissimus TaxID=88925 RepID=UPI002B4D20B3
MSLSAKKGILPTLYSFLEELEQPLKDNENRTSVTAAIAKKDLEGLKSKWKEEDTFYRHQDTGLSYLHMAVMKGNLDIVMYLVEAGMDVSDTVYTRINNRYRNLSCLHIAIGFKHKHLLAHLKKLGCDAEGYLGIGQDAESYAILNGMSPLHFAILLNETNTLLQLIEWQAPVNAQSNHGLTPLHLAAMLNHEDVAKILLKLKIIKDVRSKEGATPLLLAAEYGSHKVLDLLLQHGNKADIPSSDGYTALHAAAENGSVNALILLSKTGCNLDGPADAKNHHLTYDLKGATALHLAVATGKRYAVEALLKQGSDANIVCSYSKVGEEETVTNVTALHLAVVHNSEFLCNILLKYNAKINIQTSEKSSPLLLSISENNLKVGKLLLEHEADVNVNNGAPLFTAVRKKYLDFCNLLLQQPDILLECRNTFWEGDSLQPKRYEMTPLHLAALNGMKALANKLLDLGADVNTKMSPKEGLAPSINLLHTLASSLPDDTSLLERIVEAGCPIDEQTSEGRTPLSIAVQMSHHSLVNFFIEQGADINLADQHGYTPLLTAADLSHPSTEVVELLIKGGCDVDRVLDVEHGGFAAIHLAIARREIKIVKLLIEGECDVNKLTSGPYLTVNLIKATPLVIAIRELQGDDLDEVVELLLKKGADISLCYETSGGDEIPSYGDQDQEIDGTLQLTPLHAAVFHDRVNVIRTLIRHGASVNARSPTGVPLTPLSMALREENFEVAKLLVKKGADVNPIFDEPFSNYQGLEKYPFHHAIAVNGPSLLEMLDLLADFGADVFSLCALPDKEVGPMTALSLACAQECEPSTDHPVQKVMRIGADVNAYSPASAGLPPLTTFLQTKSAVCDVDLEDLEILLKHGADPNRTNDKREGYKNQNPLNIAAEYGDYGFVPPLIKAGADVMMPLIDEVLDTEVLPAFHILFHEFNDKSKMLFFNHGTDINFSGHRGFNILNYVAKDVSDDGMVEHLLKLGADVNQEAIFAENNGDDSPEIMLMAPIHMLLMRGWGCEEVADQFIKSSGNVNMACFVDQVELSVLMLCMMVNDSVLAEKLIRFGADINFQDPVQGQTALFLAIDDRDYACFQVLMDAGCDVNLQTNLGITPVIQATMMGDIEMVRSLIGANCDVNATCVSTGEPDDDDDDDNGDSGGGGDDGDDDNDDDGGASTDDNDNDENEDDDDDDDGVDGDAEEEFCNDATALHQAAELGHTKIVKMLLEAGAWIDARETHKGSPGFTPLHCAVVGGHWDIVSVLVEAKCNINAQTEEGMTVLHLAVKENNMQMAKFLNDIGVNPTIKNKSGQLASALSKTMHFTQELVNFEVKWAYHHNRPSLQRKRLSLHQRLSMQNLGLFGMNTPRDVKVSEGTGARGEAPEGMEDASTSAQAGELEEQEEPEGDPNQQPDDVLEYFDDDD